MPDTHLFPDLLGENEKFDKKEIIDIVNNHKAENGNIKFSKVSENKAYYIYNYKTQELKYIEEVYVFDGEYNLGNLNEKILN